MAFDFLARHLRHLGDQNFKNGDYNQAIRNYLRAIHLNGDSSAYLGFVNTEEGIGNIQGALSVINQAIKSDSQRGILFNLRGRLYKDIHKYTLAMRDYNHAIQFEDDSPYNDYIYNFCMGQCYYDINDYSMANNYFDSASKYLFSVSSDDQFSFYLISGNSFMNSGDYSIALSAFNSAISIKPDVFVTYYNRAHCLFLTLKYYKESYNMLEPNVKSRYKSTIKHDLAKVVKLNPKMQSKVDELKKKYSLKTTSRYHIHLNSDENPMKELNDMIGLSSVKQNIKDYITSYQIHKRAQALGRNSNFGGMNLIFEGGPGTGKTQVAKLFPKILCQYGVLKKPVFVSCKIEDLSSEYIGKSGKNMAKKIQDALGGVLFIDEAYDLAPEPGANNQGKTEIMNTFIQGIENHRNDLIVIMAGYPLKMQHFLKVSNPGLRSRFNHIIKFPDYSPDEMYKIFLGMVLKNRLIIKAKDLLVVKKGIKDFVNASGAKGRPSSNGRDVRNIFDFINQAKNHRIGSVANVDSLTDEQLSTITGDDIVNGLRTVFNEVGLNVPKSHNKKHNESVNLNPLDKLNHMIGLKSVKSQISGYIDRLKASRLLGGSGSIDLGSMNMVFEGAPGTGKTVVARLVAQIMYREGLVKKPNLVECSGGDLVGQYIGQTTGRTKKIVESAFGGVLFIDEAYQLEPSSSESGGDDFNSEAVTELIQLMENHRNELLVIMAGYTGPMQHFLNTANPGLNSRFKNKIIFPNYNSIDMYQILMLDSKNPKYKCVFTDESKSVAKTDMQYFCNYISKANLRVGNGRDARNIMENIVSFRDIRIVHNINKYKNNRKAARKITKDDVDNGFHKTLRSKVNGGGE